MKATAAATADAPLGPRALEIEAQLLDAAFVRTDRIFGVLMPIQWLAGIAATLWISPRTWIGDTSEVHAHVIAAIFLGGAITAFPTALAWLRPGRASTRHAIAVGQMLTSALLIHLSGGRIETHFHVFGSLAFLAFYRDWKVLLTATLVIATDHVLRGIWWPLSVYGVASASPWRALEHAGWVLFEDVVLFLAVRDSRRAIRADAGHRAELEHAHRDVEAEVKVRTRELAESESRYRSLSASSPVGIFEADRQGELVYANPRFFEILAEPEARCLGLGWLDVVHPTERIAVHREWREAIGCGSPFHREMRLIGKDDAVAWLVMRASPRIDEHGAPIGWVGTAEDITARKAAEAGLVEARESALEVARLKSEFLANMSHEIRTPLNGVMGMLELAIGTDVASERRDYLETAMTSADSLLTVINDILDFSKIESGKLEIEKTPFDLRECLASAMRILSLRGAQRGLEIACDVAPGVPNRVIGDPTRLRQVLMNLIGNAIKFTEQGEIVVRVRRGDEGARDRLELSVSDTGIGIPVDRQRAIFDAFSQADGSTTRRFGGTGLGLAISSRLVSMMGGRLGVESEPGRGSTFRFTIDLPEDPDATRSAAVAASLGGRCVLVVDDNETNLEILTHMLQREGARVLSALGARAALASLKQASIVQAPVELVILDHQMPYMDGLQLAAEIRRLYPPAPALVLLSSSGFHGEADRCHQANFAAILTKPVFSADLATAVARALPVIPAPAAPRAEALGLAPPAPPVTAPASAAEPVLGLEPLRVLLAEDNPVNAKVAVALLQRRGHQVVAVVDGRQAVERFRSEPFDVILMDVQMPELDGFAATAQVREIERERGGRIPIVALTAHAMKGDRERCLVAGMDGYATKPFKADELMREIARVMTRDERREAA